MYCLLPNYFVSETFPGYVLQRGGTIKLTGATFSGIYKTQRDNLLCKKLQGIIFFLHANPK